MNTFYIEKTKLKDTRFLSKLECACYGYSWHPYANWAWKALSSYGYGFTAKSSGDRKIIGGMGATSAKDGMLYLDTVFVSPAWRKKGVAKLLIRKIIRIADKGALPIEAHVDETNIPMVKLLKRFGFTKTGKAGNYYDEQPPRSYLLYRRPRRVRLESR